MNRFDDNFLWRMAKFMIAPIISAAVMWVCFRIEVEHRLTSVETTTYSLVCDVRDIKGDVKELLRRVR